MILSVCAILISFFVVSSVLAQSTQSAPGSVGQAAPVQDQKLQIVPPLPTDSGGALFGQAHHYSVTFRGNGEANVLLTTIFSNQSEAPVTTFSLRVPRVAPEDLVVYQVLKDPVCVQYRSVYLDEVQSPNQDGFVRDPNCLQYRDPDYNDFLYGGEGSFKKAEITLKGDNTIEVALPTPVGVEKAGSLLIYYRARGYASRDLFGRYDYTFETLKVDAPITTLQVGVSVDSDQVLKGVKGEVEYRFADPGVALKSAASEASTDSILTTYYSQIGQGQVVKTASNLQPLESYTVRGAFATSVLQLYGREIALGGVGILAVVVILLMVLRRVFGSARVGAPGRGPSAAIVAVALGSFVLSLIAVGFTIGLFSLVTSISASSYDAPVYPLILLFVAVLAVFAYAILVILPAVVVGARRGIWWGVGLFVATGVWLGLYMTVFVMMTVLTRTPAYPYPIPMMRDGAVQNQVEDVPPMKAPEDQ